MCACVNMSHLILDLGHYPHCSPVHALREAITAHTSTSLTPHTLTAPQVSVIVMEDVGLVKCVEV